MRTRVIPLTGLLAITGVLSLLDGGKGLAQQAVPDFLQKIQAGRPAAENESDLIREFLVTPQAGPWMICVASYVGPESAHMARDFVLVLREPTGPYKMPAYIFNRGADERLQEQQRVEQYKQQLRERYKQIGIEMPARIRVPRMRIEDQCAVLVGGFKDMKSARAYLDVIKKLDLPDPQKVKMDSASVIEMDKKGKATKAQGAWINPFKHSFVVPNPTTPPQAANNTLNTDPFIKTLNANEKFSMLKCPRPYTFMVKQFQGAAVVQQDAGSGVFGKVGTSTGGINGATLENSAKCAQSLAGLLNKMGFPEVYILHTRYNSMVSVGSFDDEKDPRLQRTLQMWTRLQQKLPQEQLAQLQFLPQPLPFVVPRPK
jgi:hypothetical protein